MSGFKRLTARSPRNNLAYLVNVKPDEQEVDSKYPNTLRAILDAFERLGQYEETGLAPEEITELRAKLKTTKNNERVYREMLNTSQCEEDKLKNELQIWKTSYEQANAARDAAEAALGEAVEIIKGLTATVINGSSLSFDMVAIYKSAQLKADKFLQSPAAKAGERVKAGG